MHALAAALMLLPGALSAPGPISDPGLIPTPQYFERLKGDLLLDGSRPVAIAVGEKPDPKISLAAELVKAELEAKEARLRGRVTIVPQAQPGAVAIVLADASGGLPPEVRLNVLDEQVLARHFGQSYVLRIDGETAWIAGRPQGILYGAMTLLELLKEGAGLRLPGVSIRDFPDFEYRTAARYIMNGEVNRWCLDRGQGLEAYEALVQRKLDLCLRFKINMVVFDGFGWGLKERFAEYPALMQRLNAHARARGIHLIFGGYGAGYGISFQKGPLYESTTYLGQVPLNRRSYPDGPTYPCIAERRSKAIRAGVDTALLGSCRSNDELNRIKAEELREFVRAVEPGALYIHHEDFGGVNTTEASWKVRCEHCRERWPNDDVAAADGGAGGIGHGYSCLVRAVNEVKNPRTGYDASRDCLILLTSPVYTAESSSEGWSRALRHWQNVGRVLGPKTSNVLVAFREAFPLAAGGGSWTESFNQAMQDAGLDLGLIMLVAGGGENWLNDYPFVPVPVLNSLFLGARASYFWIGDDYGEPQFLLNAEYTWNVASSGFSPAPRSPQEAQDLWRRLIHDEATFEELYGERGFLRRACERLYGAAAAAPMMKYFREHRVVPPARRGGYLPMAWDKVYATPALWRYLLVDAATWGKEITNETYLEHVKRLRLDRGELHGRLKRQWELKLEALRKGEEYLEAALRSTPSEPSRDDLEFLLESTRTAVPVAEALVDFHEFLRGRFAGNAERGPQAELLRRAQTRAKEASTMAEKNFPRVVDPAGAEVGVVKSQLESLSAALGKWSDAGL